MGYRSDVRIVTSKKGFDKLKNYVDERIANCVNPNMMYNLLDNLDINYENSYSKYFGWDNIKWYYQDVDIVMEGLRKLQEDDYSYRFAILGENNDDYEEEYYESENNEDEQDLEFPCLQRYFDDDYTIENMINCDKNEKSIEEI